MSVPASIHIIGGGQGTGRWLIDRVLTPLAQTGRLKLFAYDTNAKALATFGPAVTACPTDTIRPDVFSDQFSPGDWVFLATPPPALPGVLDQFLPLLKPGTLLITMASVQGPPTTLLAGRVPPTHSFCGLHLLCGPDVPSPVGQFAVVTGTQPNDAQHLALKNLLAGVGLIVSTLDPGEHDRQMAYVQALTHFCLLGFAGTVGGNTSGGDAVRPGDLFKVQTPNFQFLYAFASRMLKIAPTTTGSIQATPEAAAVRARLLETLQTLHRELSAAESVSAAAAVIEQFREPFKAHEVDEGATVAAVAVHQRQLFHDRLYAHRATGELLVFRHRGADRIRLVRVLELRHDEVDVEEAVVVLPHGQGTRIAVATNEIARRNYLSLGIRIPLPVRETIKKRNIQPLSDAEAAAFWQTGVVPMTLDVTLTNPNALSPEQCERGLPKLIDAAWRVTQQSVYRGPDGVEKITLRIEFDPAWTRESIIDRVKAVIERGQIWV